MPNGIGLFSSDPRSEFPNEGVSPEAGIHGLLAVLQAVAAARAKVMRTIQETPGGYRQLGRDPGAIPGVGTLIGQLPLVPQRAMKGLRLLDRLPTKVQMDLTDVPSPGQPEVLAATYSSKLLQHIRKALAEGGGSWAEKYKGVSTQADPTADYLITLRPDVPFRVDPRSLAAIPHEAGHVLSEVRTGQPMMPQVTSKLGGEGFLKRAEKMYPARTAKFSDLELDPAHAGVEIFGRLMARDPQMDIVVSEALATQKLTKLLQALGALER